MSQIIPNYSNHEEYKENIDSNLMYQQNKTEKYSKHSHTNTENNKKPLFKQFEESSDNFINLNTFNEKPKKIKCLAYIMDNES